MRAVIGGVEIEGTPDEIMEYKRLDAIDKQRRAADMLMMGMPVYVGYSGCVCNIMQEDE